jgi:A/G-specific adenine glycosylase
VLSFAERLLRWYRQHGRHDLPWQFDKSLYRTWVSEIMLQQTQVATVIPYFETFMQRFPDIKTLAEASQDDVLLHWAGLGYYSRARNLHKAALLIVAQHQGQFPQQYEAVVALPGIGPSTAGAILAQSLGQRHAILDGNVKRVLARHRAIEGWPGQTQVEKQLWQWAETYTPQHSLAEYTQAIMDLGATVCSRASAKCEACPLRADCKAHAQGRVADLPGKKAKKLLPVREKRFLIIRNEQGCYLMEKRPPAGIWGGLWSLPELAMDQLVDEAVKQNWQLTVNNYSDLSMFRHTFSHFHLDITPCKVQVEPVSDAIAESERYQWRADISQLALAAPVSAILNTENNTCN